MNFVGLDQTLSDRWHEQEQQRNFLKDARALKCARTVLLSRPRLLTSSSGQDLADVPLLVLDFLKVYDDMDQI
ncbi:hypothetical protein TNCV_162141 [Trichonephila clavipes]|nr:hypothetical protein TNCV_162141 [Trichonephila clavipes]